MAETLILASQSSGENRFLLFKPPPAALVGTGDYPRWGGSNDWGHIGQWAARSGCGSVIPMVCLLPS